MRYQLMPERTAIIAMRTPRYTRGVRTNVGTMLMASMDFAYTPFTSPASEKTSAVRTANPKMMRTLCIARWRPVKKADTRRTIAPTSMPRTMPPEIKPMMRSQGGVGETSISSMPRKKNFDWKKVNEVLEYALVTMASMTSPGTTKLM